MARYTINRLEYREEPWKLVVHRLEYEEKWATLIIHRLEVFEVEGGRKVVFDLEMQNVPLDYYWDLNWLRDEVSGFVVPGSEAYGPARVSGEYVSAEPLYAFKLLIAGNLYPADLPIYESEYRGWRFSTTLFYDVEMQNIYSDYGWHVTWIRDPYGGVIIPDTEGVGPRRVTGQYTSEDPLYMVSVGWQDIPREELPVIGRVYQPGTVTHYLDYDLYIEEVAPYSQIWINYMDTPDHGFFVAGRTTLGSLQGTFDAGRFGLYQVAIMGNGATLQTIPAGELPIGPPPTWLGESIILSNLAIKSDERCRLA